MDFLLEFREPREVYRAAIGDPAPLAERLRSGVTLSAWDREAIALLISGALIPPKSSRSNTRRGRVALQQAIYRRSLWQKRKNAVVLYRYIMADLKARGESYGASEKVITYVAEYDGISEAVLRQDIRRSQACKSGFPKKNFKAKATIANGIDIPEHPKTDINNRDLKSATLSGFENWCHIYWGDVQQFSRKKHR